MNHITSPNTELQTKMIFFGHLTHPNLYNPLRIFTQRSRDYTRTTTPNTKVLGNVASIPLAGDTTEVDKVILLVVTDVVNNVKEQSDVVKKAIVAAAVVKEEKKFRKWHWHL